MTTTIFSSSATSPSKTASKEASAPSAPWVERYRPKNLEEVSHQSEVVRTLQTATATGKLPHLLLYGPPGTGKTSVALALCRQLWDPETHPNWRRRVLELNASDERGISIVRDKIKHFASLQVGGGTSAAAGMLGKPPKGTKSVKSFFQAKQPPSSSSSSTTNKSITTSPTTKTVDNEKKEKADAKKYPNPKFKIIILDEADTVSSDAQAALRRIIEAYSRTTRFILICNYVTRIIEPLASRCAKFRFQALPPKSMKERLGHIAQTEGIPQPTISLLLDPILDLSKGDMRRAVTLLQSAHLAKVRNAEDLAELAGLPPPGVINTLWKEIMGEGGGGSTTKRASFDTMRMVVENVCLDGYSVPFILQELTNKICTMNGDDDPLTELGKAKLAICIAEAEKNLQDGADEYLQLMMVCSLALQCRTRHRRQ